jgi:hypothetical protein
MPAHRTLLSAEIGISAPADGHRASRYLGEDEVKYKVPRINSRGAPLGNVKCCASTAVTLFVTARPPKFALELRCTADAPSLNFPAVQSESSTTSDAILCSQQLTLCIDYSGTGLVGSRRPD